MSGGIAIFVLTMLAVVVWGVTIGVGSHAVDSEQEALGAALLAIGVLGLAFTVVLSFTTAQAFTVPLPVFRIAGIIVGLLLMTSLIGALLPHDRSSHHDLGIYTPDNGYYYATFPRWEPQLEAGPPGSTDSRSTT